MTLIADLSYLAALGLFLILQRLSIRLKAGETRAWWASNGRDVVNALAAASLTGSIWLHGIELHLALVLGASLTLALTILRTIIEGRVKHPERVIIVIAAVLGAPLLVAPQELARGTAAVLAWAFPG